jgi:hypothetical protein
VLRSILCAEVGFVRRSILFAVLRETLCSEAGFVLRTTLCAEADALC